MHTTRSSARHRPPLPLLMLALIALFGPKSDWLEAHFPQWSKPVTEYDRSTKTHTIVKESEIVGFDQAEAARALIEECTRRGIFDPTGKMRGRGAHLLPSGGLILHFGGKLLAAESKVDGTHKGWRWGNPGLYEGHVYPTAEAIPHPWHEPVGAGPGQKLFQLFSMWRFKRRELDARLLVGWASCAPIGGAFEWRPNIWITGGAGTGKSTINGKGKIFHQLFGGAMVRTAEASSAAIRQMLRNSTVPVLFDEIEASEDNRRVNEIVNLARVSSSGDNVHRGGQDHQAHEFTLQSCFQFSSINIPPLEPQDRSRLGILELKPFEPGDVAPDLDSYHLPKMGRQLLRRMIDQWPLLDKTLTAYKRALAMKGHSNRACDQFGTLLACAHLAMHDGVPSDEDVAYWAALCAPDKLAEVSEAVPDHVACLSHVLTSMVQARGGDEREPLGSWVGRAVVAADGLIDPTGNGDKSGERLQNYGLKLVNAKWHPPSDGKEGRWGSEIYNRAHPGYLAVAGSHQALSALYAHTKYQGGVWRHSLARFPGAIDAVKVKMGKLAATAVLIPLHAVLDDSELPAASLPESVADWRASIAGDGAPL